MLQTIATFDKGEAGSRSWWVYLNLTKLRKEYRCFAHARVSFSPVQFLLLFCSDEEPIKSYQRSGEKPGWGESAGTGRDDRGLIF